MLSSMGDILNTWILQSQCDSVRGRAYRPITCH
ncbi:hypothetical protein [Klebsiella phage vB_KpnM_TU02]|nr:hypothetical protein [Klebsiella phage vB_KpnM_TU02]